MQLRDYQEEFIGDIRGAMRQGHKAVVGVLPTGGGKTVVASFLGSSVAARGMQYWFVCHRDFLVEQTAKTFTRAGLDYGIIAAGRKPLDRPIQIVSVDTVRRRLDKVDRPGLINWDECHHIAAGSWGAVREWSGADCLHVGLTATPERLDGRGLQPPFSSMVMGPSVSYLMGIGALSQYRAFAPSMPDLSDVGTVAGDYNQRQLQQAMRESVILGDVVQTYREYSLGKRAVYFCVSIADSQALAAQFRREGINALHIDGTTPSDERTRAAVMFADGEIDVLTNCSLFGEGYDLAAQAGRDDVTIETVGLVRPTKSLPLYRQMVGRAMRPKPYPAIILDHSGVIQQHGLPDDEIEWSLIGLKNKSRPSTTKTCPSCAAVVHVHESTCPHCGAAFKRGGERVGPKRMEDAQLQEVDKELLRRQAAEKREEIAGCRTHEDFINLGIRRGYDPRWAHLQWKRARDKAENQAKAYLRDYA